ncbi:hypothetical protein WJX72_010912 [[Myrmecia] bisecta]|uniref:Uncharacterized protein n=1 Tax=[Myrmecia] bisecta TaxID=41462 RepID=A0AAW1P3U2_9CHLO
MPLYLLRDQNSRLNTPVARLHETVFKRCETAGAQCCFTLTRAPDKCSTPVINGGHRYRTALPHHRLSGAEPATL